MFGFRPGGTYFCLDSLKHLGRSCFLTVFQNNKSYLFFPFEQINVTYKESSTNKIQACIIKLESSKLKGSRAQIQERFPLKLQQ